MKKILLALRDKVSDWSLEALTDGRQSEAESHQTETMHYGEIEKWGEK